MTIEKKIDLVVKRTFDPKICRHFMNGDVQVLHCHHYATLYCQLADDAKMFDGKSLLRKAAEMSFAPVLRKLMQAADVTAAADKIRIAEEYWRYAGMGKLQFERVGEMSAAAVMEKSHVDEGWIKKWGKREAPVNFIGQGYLAAAMAVIYDLPNGSYLVNENASIVSGADVSRFTVVRF